VTGDVRGGAGTGAGVWIDGGADNTLTTAKTLSAVSGVAVLATSGNDSVFNDGLAVGNFFLGGGANALINNQRATLITFDTIDLRDGVGSAGTFTNSGDLLLGLFAPKVPIDLLHGATMPQYVSEHAATDPLYGATVISQVALDGDFVQTKTGHDFFDVAFGPYAYDHFDVTGSAIVDGTADVTLTWLQDSNPVPLWAAAAGGTDNGLEVTDTLAMDYHILANASGIELAFDTHFAQPFLNGNENAIASSLDSAVATGNAAGIGRLLALLGNLTAGQEQLYAGIMKELDPELLSTPVISQFHAAREFGSDLFGCASSAVSQNRACLWGYADRDRVERDSSRGDIDFRQSATNHLRVGGQLPIGEGLQLGAAVGVDDIGHLAADGARGIGDATGLHAGLGLRKLLGAAGNGSASIVVSVGKQRNHMTRSQSVFVSGTGRSQYTIDYAGVTANIGYSLGHGIVFARPELEASMFGMGFRHFEEVGLSGLGVEGLSHRDWVATATPKLTLGAHLGRSAVLSVTGGGVFHNRGDFVAPYRLLGADDGADPAFIRTRFDRSAFMAGADLIVGGIGPVSANIGYRGEFGKSVDAHDVHFRLNLAF
jgi:hypothetical protein